MLFGLEYHLVDSCNLRCAGCSHYSSLLDKETYPSLEDIINDLQYLKNKIGDNLKWLRLLGGEPLIHPDINECLKNIRKLFPNTEISIVTNGLLLKKMKQDFYDTCLNSKIVIRITDYGVIDLENTLNTLRERGIIADCYKRAHIWRYQHIRLTEDRIDCLKRCRYKNNCNNYKNGKIYLCPHIAYIEYFNKYFNKNIKLEESDYISLDKVKSFEEIIEKINNAKPNFCYQYCNYYDTNHPKTGEWKRTKKDINEFCLLK
jgi:ABC-2 type transport system ATP-binding protein